MNIRAALAVCVGSLALAAPAQADDASVFAAYKDTLAPEREAATLELIDAYEALDDGATKEEVARVKAANTRLVELHRAVMDAIAAQEPSTEKGAKAKKLNLRSEHYYLRVQNAEIRGDELWLEGKRGEAKRYYAKCDRMYKRWKRMARQVKRAYADLGFKL